MDLFKFQMKKEIISTNLCNNSFTEEFASQSKEKFTSRSEKEIASQSKETYTHNCASPEHLIKNNISKDIKEKDIPKKMTDINLEDSSIQDSMAGTSNDIHYDFTQRSILKQHKEKTSICKLSEETSTANIDHNKDHDCSKRRVKSPNFYVAASTSTPKKPKVCEANPRRKFTKDKNSMDSSKLQMIKDINFIDLCEDSFNKDLASLSEEAYNCNSLLEQIKKNDLTTTTPSTSISSASTLPTFTPSTFNPPAVWKNYKERCILLNEMKNEYLIAGVKVIFPVEPYDAQKSLMRILIKNCTNSTNCLIESPTGSGKTLALLCSALAWQIRFAEDIEWAFDDLMRRSQIVGEGIDYEKDNCCAQDNKGSSTSDSTNLMNISELNEPYYESMINLCDVFDDEEGKYTRIPKIYYATRTHRQIKQVVKELGRTIYKNTKMTILSSREHTCIQDIPGNKTEHCLNLLDPEKPSECPYYNNTNKKDLSTFAQLREKGISMPFDIEDIVEVGRKNNLCPYFAAKSLVEEAEIIFCPYNYIIDPDIRESMQINLKNQVIIFDEGHNIEEICRQVAGAKFTTIELEFIIENCNGLIFREFVDHIELDAYKTIKYYVTTLNEFMNQTPLSYSKNSTEMSSAIWTGNQLIGLLEMNNIGLREITKLSSATRFVIDEFNKAKEDLRNFKSIKKKLTVSRTTKILLQRLTLALKTIATQEYENDYKAFIEESSCSDLTDRESWMLPPVEGKRLRTFKLICLNSAIIFGPLARDARSIILASGTLSPTGSFESELGTKFADIHYTDHVIGKDQVFVKCVPRGPGGTLLRANFTNVNTWQFQDELGQLILNIIEVVPHGVLCFFSSYIMMNNQITRWKFTNIWQNIQRYKKIFVEPRERSDLKDVMKQYREVINETSEVNVDNNEGHSGAILFAVFRGKVAEGIDFSDNEARCVITIGIPYPVKNNKDVQMKWNYNDKNTSRGLLKGYDWYNIQAYRAYNQALGRCIRHKNDWGAILLVDERFLIQTYQTSLPKWTRDALLKNSKNENIMEELKAFVRSKKTSQYENVE